MIYKREFSKAVRKIVTGKSHEFEKISVTTKSSQECTMGLQQMIIYVIDYDDNSLSKDWFPLQIRNY